MIFDCLKESKEDHDINHHILEAKMDKCYDGIQSISISVETIAEVKEQIQGYNKILKDIQNQMQKNWKAKTTNIEGNWPLNIHILKYFGQISIINI